MKATDPIPADIADAIGVEVGYLVQAVSPGPGWTSGYRYQLTVVRTLPDGSEVEDTYTSGPVAVRS